MFYNGYFVVILPLALLYIQVVARICVLMGRLQHKNKRLYMKKVKLLPVLYYLVVCTVIVQAAAFLISSAPDDRKPVKKVLFIGDSMTGWLSERLNAYGEENGFEVATVVWDGSTIAKWGNSPKLESIVKAQDPDAVFISLGMNELFEPRPDVKLKGSVEKIRAAAGDRPILWVGPPSWPGHDKGKILNDWLAEELGEDSYFRSSDLDLPRQSAKNPHPTRSGMVQWMDSVVKWMPDHASVVLPGISKPEGAKMSRGKSFVYKRMKEAL